MSRILLTLTMLLTTSFSIVDASESQWYWVSVTSNPMSGYFTEGPNTVGKSDEFNVEWTSVNGRPIISTVRTPLPNGFMDVMDDTEGSDKCSDKLDEALSELRAYDLENNIVSSFKSSEWVDEESYEGREGLLSSIIRDAEQCLGDEVKEIEAEEKRIEEEREQQEVAEKRSEDIEKAIHDCDFDYFDSEMTNDERMATYYERIACQDRSPEDTVLEEINPDIVHVPPVVPVITPEPVVKEVEPQSAPETDVLDEREIEQATTSVSVPPETVEMTQDELDQLVEQRVNEALEESESEPSPEPEKPSLFKKVVNFLFSWMR